MPEQDPTLAMMDQAAAQRWAARAEGRIPSLDCATAQRTCCFEIVAPPSTCGKPVEMFLGGEPYCWEHGSKIHENSQAIRRQMRSMLAPHMQRVVDEKTTLDEKLVKLNDFVGGSPLYHQCSEAEQERLSKQACVMAEYSQILGQRIAAFPVPG